MTLLTIKVQRSSFYDGPGIRTIVFLKGCSLRCPWCCNPETISSKPQVYFNGETGTKGVYGKEIQVRELVEVLKKDKPFYQSSGGGVTFSGGEPLLQAKALAECLENLKKENIHTAIETSLFCSLNSLDLVKEFVDLFVIDVKILDPKDCKKYLGGDLEVYLQNIERVFKMQKNCVFRFPAVKPYTFNESNLKLLHNFLKKWKIKKIEIFSVHNLAKEKYKSLGMEPLYFEEVKKEELEKIKKQFSSLSLEMNILNI